MRIKNFRFGVLLIAAAFATASFGFELHAQATRVLYCNEKDTVSDRMNYPRQATVVKTVSGTVSYLLFKAYIGNDPGTYEVTISSYYDFKFRISEKQRLPKSKWLHVSEGGNAWNDGSPNGLYMHSYTFTSRGVYSEGSDIAIMVYPDRNNSDVNVSWFTTGCRKKADSPAPSDSKSCTWVQSDIYGIAPPTCQCNGLPADARKCGPRP